MRMLCSILRPILHSIYAQYMFNVQCSPWMFTMCTAIHIIAQMILLTSIWFDSQTYDALHCIYENHFFHLTKREIEKEKKKERKRNNKGFFSGFFLSFFIRPLIPVDKIEFENGKRNGSMSV